MTLPIDNIPPQLLKQYQDDLANMFFFAGAGISISSSIPDVSGMLSCTADVFLPDDLTRRHRKRILNLQPEIIYEAIIRITGSRECLHLWKALRPGTHQEYDLKCIPNIAHNFIVTHAAHHNVPIFTTNFDTMFEQAATSLGYEPKVYLPSDAPPNLKEANIGNKQVAICKIHGSICSAQGEYTPENLLTTITEISSINVPWLELIAQLMREKYICFVGYSGRDIDLFPEIKRFSAVLRQTKGTSGIYWINKFEKDPSDGMSKECNAIRIEGVYPSDIFCRLAPNLPAPVDSDEEWNKKKSLKLKMLDGLKHETINKQLVTETAKRLLAAELIAKSGKYNDAARLLDDVERCVSGLSLLQQCEMLLFRARLSHELSCYEMCQKAAKNAFELATSMKNDGLDSRIQARCIMSEANRMFIPNDTFFPNRFKFSIALHLLWTLLHFQLMESLNWFDIITSGKKPESHSNHETIEHSIRKMAIIQSVLGNPRRDWPKLAKLFLVWRWRSLREISRASGYAGGIANSGKFMTRVVGDEGAKQEMDKVFDLMTHVTGQELSLRNKADNAIKQERWDDARNLLIRYYRSAKRSGNCLNAIKALIGLAYVSKMAAGVASLTPRNKRSFERLSSQVEGKYWQDHLAELNVTIISCESIDPSPCP